MKLLFCSECSDVVKLRIGEWRSCDCGRCEGHYLADGAHAEVSTYAEVIGIDNHTLRRAAAHRDHGDDGYRTLAAWVMRRDAPRVKWLSDTPKALSPEREEPPST